MKKLFYAISLALLPAIATAQDVGVNVTIGQPGFYGQIILGDAPPPELISPRPVIVIPGPVVQPPIYLRVPLAHQRHWRRYCHRYHACGRRVYFVRDRWYNNVYVPHYRRHQREYREHRFERRRHTDRDHRFERDRRDERRGRHREGRGRDH